MKATLLKDIVIPAGTVFTAAPTKTERTEGEHVEHLIGLSDNSYGSLVYSIGKTENEINELSEWFKVER